jgi:hypothetical protein
MIDRSAEDHGTMMALRAHVLNAMLHDENCTFGRRRERIGRVARGSARRRRVPPIGFRTTRVRAIVHDTAISVAVVRSARTAISVQGMGSSRGRVVKEVECDPRSIFFDGIGVPRTSYIS